MTLRLWGCWPWVAPALSGALLAFGYPPFDQGWVAWVGLVPWLAAILLRRRESRREWLVDLGIGFVAGSFFFQLAFSWLSNVTLIGAIALNTYLACYFAGWSAFVGLFAGSQRNWLSSRSNLWLAFRAAAAWVALEYVRSILFTGFGWNGLAVALWKSAALIQIADLTGTFGISFVLVFANVIALATIRRFAGEVASMRIRPHFDFTLTMAMIGAIFVYGVWSLRKVSPAVILKVAIVQASISQERKWAEAESEAILATYESLTLQALENRPQLVVWPEAATPGPLAMDRSSQILIKSLLSRADFDLLLGTLDGELRDNKEFGYNAAYLLTNQGREAQHYWKIHLVPFGEFIPFRKSFPLFAWIAGDEIPSDFDAGTETTVFQLKQSPINAAALICFEDTVPGLVGKFVTEGAEVLCNLTNDGWFQESQGSIQHLSNAIFHCIETRRPMLRAANTGVTCLIDERGRISKVLQNDEGSTFAPGVLEGEIRVPIAPSLTVYTRFGDWFAVLCCAIAVIAGTLQTRRPSAA